MLLCSSSLAIAIATVLAFHPYVTLAAAPASANAAFDLYVRNVETRLAEQHASASTFLVLPSAASGLRFDANPTIEHLRTPELPGALLHHWRATQFVPGGTAAQLDRLLKDVSAYPALFAPQVERSSMAVDSPQHLHATMRVRQEHVITVVLDTSYDVTFVQLDPLHRASISRSTGISEIDSPGSRSEHALPPDRDHGFLWRQNTYWSYEERGGGLYIQVESVSLTRSVPAGFGWAVGPYVESIPRGSLTFTLSCVSRALLRQTQHSTP